MQCKHTKPSGKRCKYTTTHRSGLCSYHRTYGDTPAVESRSQPKEEACLGGGGWIYVLVNSQMPGVVKIGRTDRSPRERVDEISAATGVPAPFVLVWEEQVSDSVAAESEVHRLLYSHRTSDDREFFRLDPKSAIEAVSQVAAKYSPAAEPAEESHTKSASDWERDDELLVAALMVVKHRGEIDPRAIRMTFDVGFEESRAVFEKLKLLGAIDEAGRARRDGHNSW